MTRPPDTERVRANVTDRFGVSVDVRTGTGADGPYIDLRPADLPANAGFVVRTALGWRHIRAQFNCETFARDLLAHMATATLEQRAQFVAISKVLSSHGGAITMKLNGIDVTPTQPDLW